MNGGVADGKTHEEIADEVNAVNASLETDSTEEAEATEETAEADDTPASDDTPTTEAPPSSATRAAGTFVGAIAATMLL